MPLLRTKGIAESTVEKCHVRVGVGEALEVEKDEGIGVLDGVGWVGFNVVVGAKVVRGSFVGVGVGVSIGGCVEKFPLKYRLTAIDENKTVNIIDRAIAVFLISKS